MTVDPTFGWGPNNHQDAPGSYTFIHSIIDPTSYYGNLPTTGLQLVGLANHNTRSFIGDTRVGGWYFGIEPDLSNASVQNYFPKYFQFFFNVVHYNGANSSFAGVYTAPGPDGVEPTSPNCNPSRLPPSIVGTRIAAVKAFFLNHFPRPDRYGFEWYGANSTPQYNLSCIGGDIQEMAYLMSTDSYFVPYSQIFLGEGATNQTGTGIAAFYQNAINATATLGLSGISVWLSDGNENLGSCSTGDVPGQAQWSLNVVLPITSEGCITFPGPPQGWHYNGNVVHDDFATTFGLIEYNTWTPAGQAVATGFSQN